MDVQSQLLLLRVLPDIKIMVAERRGSQTGFKTQHTQRCPLRSTIEGREGIHTKEESFNALEVRSATTDWQCRPARKE